MLSQGLKLRFYERYHKPTKIQSLLIKLCLLFQADNENTLDYFERLKILIHYNNNSNNLRASDPTQTSTTFPLTFDASYSSPLHPTYSSMTSPSLSYCQISS
ncbi:unnamed protein product, partial [Rotaria sordida]